MSGLVVTPHPLTLEGREILRAAEVLPGETLAAFLERHGVDLAGDWVVTIGGRTVPALMWGRTRPHHGQLIECRRRAGRQVVAMVAIVFIAWVTMGGGLAAMGIGAQAGMSAGAIAASGVSGLAGALGMSAGFAALAVNAGAMMLGSMLVNKLLAPPRAKMPSFEAATVSQTYSVSGGRNAQRPYEPLALIFGQVRVVPDFVSAPFQWFAGDDQFQEVRLHAGINCGSVSALQIGDTPIENYEDVVVSQAGFPGMTSVVPNWANVDTVAGATLTAPAAPGAWVTRTSSVDSVYLAVDIGVSLYKMEDDGSMSIVYLAVDIEYRATGSSGAWLPFVGSSARITLGSGSTKPLRRTFQTGQLAPGQYDVRMRKATQDASTTKQANTLEWGSLKSYQRDSGEFSNQPEVRIAIKASGQINGVLDAVNWLATAAATPVWNGAAWVTAPTSNPGAQILQFARGIFDDDGRLMAGMGLPDAQIDIDGLKAFMLHCAAKGYRFDHWFDGPVSCGDVLDAMAAAGLGSIGYPNGKLSVLFFYEDQPLEAVVNMGNIKKGSFRVDYATRDLAEELEVTWVDRNANWTHRSLRLKAPGVAVPRDTARVAPAGVTTEAGAALQGRVTMAQNIFQRKSVTWEMDLEFMTFRRFSLIALSHDLTKWGESGRLHSATTTGGVTTLVLDQEVQPRVGATTWFVGLRLPTEQAYRVMAVQPVLGPTHTLTLVDAWPSDAVLPGYGAANPAHDTLWIFDFKDEPGQALLVTSIEPSTALTGARITAVPTGPEFWTYINSGTYVATPAPSGSVQLVARGLAVTQDRLGLNYDRQVQLTASFIADGPFDHAQVWGGPAGTDLALIGETRTGSLGGWNVSTAGDYYVEVRPFDGLGRPGLKATKVITVSLDSPLVGGLNLVARPQFFVKDHAGVVSPELLTLTATGFKNEANLVWEVVDGEAAVTGAGAVVTVADADLVDDSATIRVSEGTAFDEVTILRLRDGLDSIRILLSNQTQAVPAALNGTVSSWAGVSTEAHLMAGATDATAAWTFAIAPSAGVTANLTTPGGVPTVSVTGMTTDSGYVDITATRTGHTSPPPARFSVSKAKAGPAGIFVDYIFKRSATVPATPAGNGLPAGWSDAPPGGTDPLYMSVADKNADNTLAAGAAWAAPVRIDGPGGRDGRDGYDAHDITVQYSVNGVGSWHSVFTAGDLYMRQSTDGGSTWSGAIRIVGEQGAPGYSSALGRPLDTWVLNGQALVNLTDGVVGTVALRLSGIPNSYPNQGTYVAIDASRTYRVRFWARPSATAAGYLYFSLRQFTDASGSPGPSNGGRAPYKPSAINRAAHVAQFGATWGQYVYDWTAADWQAGAKFVQPEFLDNYSGAAGYWDIQGFEFFDVTEAAAATAELAKIAADDWLSRDEKPAVILDWQAISNEQAGIDARATAFGISGEKTIYDAAVSALATYLGGLAPAWNDLSQHTPIVGATFRTKFADVYTARQALLNKFAEVAATLANWANVTGTGRPADGATRNQVTYGPTAPGSAADGDLWCNTGSNPVTWYVRIGGTWLVAANLVTGTGQITDSAGLGQTALWGSVSNRPKSFRASSVGGSCSSPPLSSGFYNAESLTLLAGTARSYLVAAIRRSDGALIWARNYDVYGNGAYGGYNAYSMVADLNSIGSDSIVIVIGHDEPQNNRLTSGLPAAMYRHGASRSVFGSPDFKYRSAYILVGIGGCGEANGFEAYQGAVDSDSQAWCDVTFLLLNGSLIVTGAGASPRSLADYGYVMTDNLDPASVTDVTVFTDAAGASYSNFA